MLSRLRLRGGSAFSYEGLRGANETASVQEEMDMLTGSQVLPAETNANRESQAGLVRVPPPATRSSL